MTIRCTGCGAGGLLLRRVGSAWMCWLCRQLVVVGRLEVPRV